MYSLIKEMATSNLSVDESKLKSDVASVGSTIQKDFCEIEPDIEIGLNFAINAIGNPIAKWVLELALVILQAINTKFCPVKS